MKQFLIFGIIGAFLLSSCEREMHIVLPESPPKLVVEGSIENGLPPVVSLTKSLGFFGKIDPAAFLNSFINGAKISVSNGSSTIVLKEYSLTYGDLNAFIYTIDTADVASLSFLGEVGKSYDLKIEYDGKVYTATTTIPALNYGIDSFWSELPKSESAIEENPNYRKVQAMYTDPADQINYIRVFVSTNGNGFQAPYNSIYFDDFINGTSVPIGIDPGYNRFDTASRFDLSYFQLGDTIDYKFCSIDKGTLEFYKTLEYAVGTVGNPFVAPMIVSTNIQGGALGIWAGYGAVVNRYVVKDE